MTLSSSPASPGKSGFSEIVYTRPRPHVAVVRMNRPETYNAWTAEMSDELVTAMDLASHDESVRVVVFTGTGRAFCAGGEATKLVDRYLDSADARRLARDAALLNLRNVLQVFKDFDKPTIAAVNGIAAGAAFAMTLMCDIRIASEYARFGNIYMRRGTVPSMAPYYLPRVVGLSRACRLIFADEIVDAAEAERLRLVNRVVPADELESASLALAERVARQPLAALQLAKRATHAAMSESYDTVRQFSILADLLLAGDADDDEQEESI